ncbi:SoxR reducing system RseC family protein [Marinobacter sp.]|uniref:SoxR reducing system RseC family protein n=1 Tax=Marinobacter sp. TaxID=50741 RepID=UPI00384B7BF9
MITERGRVIAVKADRVWVQTIRQSACQSCSARAACGQKVLAGMSAGRANQIAVNNLLDAAVGDEVTVAIGESALLRASLLVYALPLVLMVSGAILGQQISSESDALAVAGAGMGLGLGFLIARSVQKRLGASYAPELIRIDAAVDHPTTG